MSKKIKKVIPWFVVLILLTFSVTIGLNVGQPGAKADTAGTSVDVGNVAPEFSVDPYEDPAVHSGTGTAGTADNPVNMGTSFNIKAQAEDSNGDQWYLVICDGTNPPTTSGEQDCASGTTYGRSSLTNQGANTATASIDTSGLTNQSYAWWAYACDESNSNKCGTVDQGTGNSGTPFYVNHAATFTEVTDLDDPCEPGETVTITTTAADAEDAGTDDTLSLYVCKTQSATSAGCGGGEWCNDTSSQTSDPTCNWTMNVAKTGDLTANQCEGSYNYYAYIFDNHGFAASTGGSKQGFVFTNTVDNVVPEVTAVSLNSGSNFTPDNEEATKNIIVTGTVKDDNGCVDVDEATTADVSIYNYKLGTFVYANCDNGAEDDDNECYAVKDCAYDAASCTGTTDSDSTFTCTVALQYHVNPTDGAGSGDSPWWDYTWRATLIGSDGVLPHTLESTDIEMISVFAYDVDDGSATIAYAGPLSPEETSVSATNTIEATGNVGLDLNLYSVEANMCTVAFPACANDTMVISAQRWHGSEDVWDNMTVLTTTSSDELELNCQKTIQYDNPASATLYWKIKIPAAQEIGSYTGQNTIAGKKAETGDW